MNKNQSTNCAKNNITASISLERDILFYVFFKFSNHQQRKALIDTGACANAISGKDYEELIPSGGTNATLSPPSEVSKAKLASGQVIPVRGQTQLDFSIANQFFQEKFLVLPNKNSIRLGNPFFKINSIEIYPKKTHETTRPDPTIKRNRHETSRKAKKTTLLCWNNIKKWPVLRINRNTEVLPTLSK